MHRLRARTELDVENIRRRAVEDILLTVRERAVQALSELARSDRYPEVLISLAEAAAREMGAGGMELVMRAEDRETHGPHVAQALRERLGVGQSDRPAEVGISSYCFYKVLCDTKSMSKKGERRTLKRSRPRPRPVCR